jgi:hypothetical protein
MLVIVRSPPETPPNVAKRTLENSARRIIRSIGEDQLRQLDSTASPVDRDIAPSGLGLDLHAIDKHGLRPQHGSDGFLLLLSKGHEALVGNGSVLTVYCTK